MNNTNKEFQKISFAFKRVKEDNIYLSTKITNLEDEMNHKLNYLMQEIEILRSRIQELASKRPVEVSNVQKNQEEQIYIGNLTSKKVHVSNCPYAKKITSDNREIFETLNDALRSKYVRCSCVANK